MTTYPDDADGAVLTELAAQGVDMSQPVLIDFFVDVPDEASANAVDAALGQEGYSTEIEYDEGEPDDEGQIDPDDEEFGPSWTVCVNFKMVPDHAEIVRIQAELDRISGPLGGKSDGWGVMVE